MSLHPKKSESNTGIEYLLANLLGEQRTRLIASISNV